MQPLGSGCCLSSSTRNKCNFRNGLFSFLDGQTQSYFPLRSQIFPLSWGTGTHRPEIMRPVLAFVALLWSSFTLSAQSAAPAITQPDPPAREWQAMWITHPTAPLREPIVLHFRRTLTLAAVPATYIVRVSADNRFILYVNGHRAGDGPARGDLTHWRYERFDLAPLLQVRREPHHGNRVELRRLRPGCPDQRPHRLPA